LLHWFWLPRIKQTSLLVIGAWGELFTGNWLNDVWLRVLVGAFYITVMTTFGNLGEAIHR